MNVVGRCLVALWLSGCSASHLLHSQGTSSPTTRAHAEAARPHALRVPAADAARREDASAPYDPDTNTIRWVCLHGRPGPLPTAGRTQPFLAQFGGEFGQVTVLGVDVGRDAVLANALAERRRIGIGLSFSSENGTADSFEAWFWPTDWSSWRSRSSLSGEVTLLEARERSFDPMDNVEFDPSWRRTRRAWYTQVTDVELALTVECDAGLRTVRLVPRDGGPERESRDTDAGAVIFEEESPTERDSS